MREQLIRLPRSGRRSDSNAFLKLLHSVARESLTVWQWQGKVLRPGRTVAAGELRPEPKYPESPVILEAATSPQSQAKPGGGRYLWILWRYDMALAQWDELARADVADTDPSWAIDLAPIAIRAMSSVPAVVVLSNLVKIQARITVFLDGQLSKLPDGDRAQVLTIIHNQLSARLAHTQPEHPYSESSLRCLSDLRSGVGMPDATRNPALG